MRMCSDCTCLDWQPSLRCYLLWQKFVLVFIVPSTLRLVTFLLKQFVPSRDIEEERASTNVQKTGEIKGNNARIVYNVLSWITEGRREVANEEEEGEEISKKKETAATKEKDETTCWVDNKGGSIRKCMTRKAGRKKWQKQRVSRMNVNFIAFDCTTGDMHIYGFFLSIEINRVEIFH